MLRWSISLVLDQQEGPLAWQAGSTRFRAPCASMIGAFFGKQVIPINIERPRHSVTGSEPLRVRHNSLDCY